MQKKATLAAVFPAYLPPIGYFKTLVGAGQVVLADDVQFVRHRGINRTRIKTAAGARWLTVPVLTRGRGVQQIKDVRIRQEGGWQHKHLKTLHVAYRKAAFYEKYIDFFEWLYRQPWRYLLDLNLTCLDYLCQQLAISPATKRSSELHLREKGTHRLVEMALQCRAQTYITEARYLPVLDLEAFACAGITVKPIDSPRRPYYQLFGEFIPNLSVIDLLFNEGEAARAFLPAE